MHDLDQFGSSLEAIGFGGGRGNGKEKCGDGETGLGVCNGVDGEVDVEEGEMKKGELHCGICTLWMLPSKMASDGHCGFEKLEWQ